MKTANKWMMAAVLTAVMFTASGAWAGNLTPPGAPGATMKTLDQAEPRTPISGAITISQPGSYYLTGNSTGRITIQADNVTLDLMGFRLAISSGAAITIPSGYGNNTLIRNGTVRPGSGSYAIDARYADDCVFENLRIEGNSAWCGIYADDRCVVRNCDVRGCNNRGISVGDETEVRDCRVIGGTQDGIQAGSNGRIVGNVITGHGDDGLYITGSGTYVADNIVKGNSDNYEIAQGNQLNLLLCEIPETLDWPCSVKLAGTLTCSITGTNGITVNANDVTIDMAGHTLIGPGASSENGIYQDSAYSNLRIFNGKVVEWRGGAMAGINAYGMNAILSDLQASTNDYGILTGSGSTISDCAASYNTRTGINAGSGSTISDCAANYNVVDGIDADSGSTISGCAATINGDDGIAAGFGSTIAGCAATYNGDAGIYASYGSKISDCAVSYNGDDGINAGHGSTISDCAASYNTSIGIYAGSGSTISDCAAQYNTGDGIQVYQESRVLGCVCDSNGDYGDGAGIHATSSDNSIEGNNCTDNDRGIDVDSVGNFIVKNSCAGNGTNWDIAANNKVGVIVSAPNSGAISGSTGGSGVGSTDPWANFSY